MDIITPQQLWEDYDWSQPPNHTVISKNQTKDGHSIRLFYNGYALSDTKVRIYARLVLPQGEINLDNQSAGQICSRQNIQSDQKNTNDEFLEGSNQLINNNLGEKKPPVIIFLSTFDKDIDTIDVSFLTSKGYAVLVVDYAGGIGQKTRYTVYPKTLDAYWENQPELIKLPPTSIKTSCWYYWTTCVLHSVTFLQNCSLVDSDKIGIFGVDQGAALVWKSSFCQQIKAGTTFFSGDLMGSGEDMLLYKASLDSRAYAKNNFPILINAATNSSDGSFDYLNDLYNSAANSAFCVYPCAERAISQQQLNNVWLWFDTIFSGQPAPTEKYNLSVFGSGGAMYCEIMSSAKSVQIYYAEECSPAFRNWKQISPPRTGEEKYLTKLEIFDIERSILVFANLTFENGFEFSTAVTQKKPAKLGVVQSDTIKSRLIYQSEMGSSEWLHPNCYSEMPLTMTQGPRGLVGICGDELTTYRLGDSRFGGLSSSMLQIMISAKHQPQEIEILLIQTDAEYKCTRKISQSEWTTLSLSQEDFRSSKGMPDFDKVLGIKIRGRGIILNSLLWV